MTKSFYISTAIDYPSTNPHLGHAYEKICADVIARFKRLQGFEVHFSTGTDEHGLKIQRYAEKAGERPKEFVDRMSKKFREEWDKLDISYDDFIRTTEERHVKVVQLISDKLNKTGNIYKGVYEGLYCTECETFYPEEELVESKCPIHNKKVEHITQECYFFRMSKYHDKIVKHIKDNLDFIQPESRRNEILNRLKEPLRDLCISRTDFNWGIPLLIDKKHVLYVWVDALSNYLTTIDYPHGEKFKKFWPVDIHLIGKDISWHHCVIWSSLLLALDIPLPKKIFIHGFVTYRGKKLSKSGLSMEFDPIYFAHTYSTDALRYFLIREMSFGEDGAFSEEGLKKRLNDELADVFGNFVHRVLTFTHDRFDDKVPNGKIDKKLESEIAKKIEEIEELLEQLKITQASEKIIAIAKLGNEYFQSCKPWEAAKTDPQKAANCLFNCINLVKVLCIALYPFMPSTCENLAKQLNIEIENWEQTKKVDIKHGHAIQKPTVLFKKTQASETKKEKLASISDFEKLEIRIAKVVKAERIPNSKKLLKLEVDIAGKRRTLVAGVAGHYTPEELIEKHVVVLVNIEPTKLMGVTSEGMILAAIDDDKISLLTVDKPVKHGSKVE
ncbi:MAG: methionine--tRNA ligase [Hadesarchaea archaeon CG08_land_8_20_14_0_20_51_8]|nr:MAG: methionine--tRNA ligase [Hadesarchaea archaeon CG08_land_8_20_14_0_20_51_8]